MSTRVTIHIIHANQPVEVQVLTRQHDGSFAAPMPPTRIEREGDVCTFHVHANQRLQVVEGASGVVTGDGSGTDLPPLTEPLTARVGDAVHSRRAKSTPPLPPAAPATADSNAAMADTRHSEAN